MRTYGRIYKRNADGSIDKSVKPKWVEVSTDASGDNTMVYLTTLCQVLQGNIGESPFYGDWGISQHPSIVNQIFPDHDMAIVQQRFSQYFLSLTITKQNTPFPYYKVDVITNRGQALSAQVAV